MNEKKIYEDLSPLQNKAQLTRLGVQLVFLVLLFSFWKIQILDHKKYWNQSEANRIREMTLPPQRGLIKDRNGEILAKNIASFKVSIIRENCRDFEESCQKISALLELEPEVLKERINRLKDLPLFQPVVVKDNLSIEEVSKIKARKIEFPELVIQSEPKRYYPHKSLAAHVIGYLQEVSPAEMRSLYKDRDQGDLVGKTGIEREYEDLLVGKSGRMLEVVDSVGREREEISRINPTSGKDISLTLDFQLQKRAEELLGGREGAAVAVNPKNGEILTLASFPTFDPNKFINRFTPDEWMALIQSPEFPLENRAIRGLYAPGSIFKLVLALGALESKIVNEWNTFYCSGTIRLYGHPRACWFRGGHGSMNLSDGIKNSCNIYFYQVGKMLGIDRIAHYARMLGFGEKTGVDLPGEKIGLVPDPDWKKRVRKEPWYPGETISVAIGQGPISVTPLQVALYTACIANRGKKVSPYLYKKKAVSDEETDPVTIQKDTFEKVIKGMWRSVNEEGTGRGSRVEDFDVCGKTGSTQLVSSVTAEKLGRESKIVKTHSWFTGFAPKDNPQIVVTVLVEYGGMGGATAAPIAGELFRLFRENHDR
jgi:penicillin-binding protein 2